MEAYCMKCKAKREMKDVRAITMKNGRPATQGVCPTCGTKMFKIGQSHAVTLPPAWVSRHGAIAKEVTLIGNDVLLIVPLGFERQAEAMARQIEGSIDMANDSDKEGGTVQ